MKTLATALAGALLMTWPAAADTPKVRQGASIQSVIQGFVDAAYLYCLPYVIDGVDFSEDLHPQAPSQIVPASAARARNATAENWVIDGIGEIVLIEGGADHSVCRVSAYGPSVETTFDLLQARISAPDFGFVLDVDDRSEPRVILRTMEMQRDGMLYRVVLRGNEPGARGTRSRFSTLTMAVRADPVEAVQGEAVQGETEIPPATDKPSAPEN